ncbi:MAG: CAP domain-containing protein [Nocardioides sp.]
MRTTALVAALLAAAVALPAPAGAMSADARPHVKPRSDAWEAKVLRLTNARRKAHGVKPLRAASCPDRLAERWTRHMARTHDFEHQSLDPFFKCRNTSTAGENIAFGYETPHALVSAWMHSKGHRENILDPHFHRIGVAGWRDTDGRTYATQDFIG